MQLSQSKCTRTKALSTYTKIQVQALVACLSIKSTSKELQESQESCQGAKRKRQEAANMKKDKDQGDQGLH